MLVALFLFLLLKHTLFLNYYIKIDRGKWTAVKNVHLNDCRNKTLVCTWCLPEFYSERLINMQGPLTAGISGVAFQNQMTLSLPDHTTTFYNVDPYTSFLMRQFVHLSFIFHLPSYLHFQPILFVGISNAVSQCL